MSRILVIDGDPGERLIVRSRLADAGHFVTVAENGACGLMEGRNGVFDVILLAAHLGPGVEATEVCRRLKAVPKLGAVPVIMYCGQPSTDDLCDRAYEAGAECFLTKHQISSLDRVVHVMARIKARNDEVTSENRALESENKRLDEERRLVQKSHGETAKRFEPRDSFAGRPDGVLVVDSQAVVRHVDRGACELLGTHIEGRRLGAIAPSSGLEAFVRDARNEPRDGFRFDLSDRRGRSGRSLMASVMPVTASDPLSATGRRIVLLFDVGKRRFVDNARLNEVGRHQLGTLLEAARVMYRPEAFVGDHDVARDIRRQVNEVSESCSPVLVSGPRGAGKELIARIIHYGGVSTGSLLQIRCGSLAPETLENELFGHVKGASADKVADKPGMILAAHDGTLLLAEIADLPLELQHKLLEVMETGSVLRAGRSQREPVDVRVIATTSRDLKELASRGQFLPELLAKLSMAWIEAPALRRRIGDVPAIAAHFIERFGGKGSGIWLDSHAVWVMQQYDWPGNVAELEDCVEQACRRTEDGEITVDHLTRPLRDLAAELPEPDLIPARRPERPSTPETSRRELAPIAPPTRSARPWDITDGDPISFELYEKKALLRALDSCGGDKLATARLLKVGKSTLYRKLKRFGIT